MLKIHIILDLSFPEELVQGKSQNIGVETFENPLHFQIRAFLEDLAKANLKMLGRTQFSQKT
ncbi:hypothetical protein E2320_022443 [Naja naja]|nr:hypothetical protein E2320_022443 [Naja naja]